MSTPSTPAPARSGPPDVLKRILARKREEIVERCERRPLRELGEMAERAPAPRQFQLSRCKNIRLVPAESVLMPVPMQESAVAVENN